MMGSCLADLIGSAFGGVAASWLRGTKGACDALIQDGILSYLAIIPADRFQDVG